MSGYPNDILTGLFESNTNKTESLTGGARLDWDAAAKTLTATRLNRGLETKPSEQATFEAYIRKCGYTPSQAETVTLPIDAHNERIGVQWVIAKAKRSKAAMKREAQGSLF